MSVDDHFSEGCELKAPVPVKLRVISSHGVKRTLSGASSGSHEKGLIDFSPAGSNRSVPMSVRSTMSAPILPYVSFLDIPEELSQATPVENAAVPVDGSVVVPEGRRELSLRLAQLELQAILGARRDASPQCLGPSTASMGSVSPLLHGSDRPPGPPPPYVSLTEKAFSVSSTSSGSRRVSAGDALAISERFFGGRGGGKSECQNGGGAKIMTGGGASYLAGGVVDTLPSGRVGPSAKRELPKSAEGGGSTDVGRGRCVSIPHVCGSSSAGLEGASPAGPCAGIVPPTSHRWKRSSLGSVRVGLCVHDLGLAFSGPEQVAEAYTQIASTAASDARHQSHTQHPSLLHTISLALPHAPQAQAPSTIAGDRS